LRGVVGEERGKAKGREMGQVREMLVLEVEHTSTDKTPMRGEREEGRGKGSWKESPEEGSGGRGGGGEYIV